MATCSPAITDAFFLAQLETHQHHVQITNPHLTSTTQVVVFFGFGICSVGSVGSVDGRSSSHNRIFNALFSNGRSFFACFLPFLRIPPRLCSTPRWLALESTPCVPVDGFLSFLYFLFVASRH